MDTSRTDSEYSGERRREPERLPIRSDGGDRDGSEVAESGEGERTGSERSEGIDPDRTRRQTSDGSGTERTGREATDGNRTLDRGDGHPSRTGGRREGRNQHSRAPSDEALSDPNGSGHAGATDRETRSHPTPPDDRSGSDAPAEPPPERETGEELHEDDGTTDWRLSRRRLVAGGAAVGLVGIGGWVYASRGLEGARAVARAYVQAIADDNWTSAQRLFHEDADVIRRIEQLDDIQDYEDALAAEKRLERMSDLDPEIEGVYEYEHVPDPEPDIERVIYRAPRDLDRFEAWKHVIVVVTVDVDAWYSDPNRSDRAEYYADGETRELVSVGTVRDEGEWYLWNAVL